METFKHLVTECPRLHTQRTDIFLDNIPTSDPNSWSVQDLLDFSELPLVANAVDRIYLTEDAHEEESVSTLSEGSE